MNIKSIGRNDPCPCGSGKKYKQCCQNKENNNSEAAKNRLLESIPDLFAKALKAELHDLTLAKSLYEQILAINPKHTDSLNNLAVVLINLNQAAYAQTLLEKLIKIEPSVKAFSNLGLAYKEQQKKEEAIVAFKKALELNPGSVEVYSNIGLIYLDALNYKEAAIYFNKALYINPNDSISLSNFAIVLMHTGNYKLAAQHFQNASKLINHTNIKILQNLLLCLCFDKNSFPIKYLNEAKFLEKAFKAAVKTNLNHQILKDTNTILKIGFVSGDFYNHPVGFFLESVLENLTNHPVELFAYSCNHHQDDLTQKIKPYFKAWHDITSLSDSNSAKLILSDQIHILIDLSGHTANNRLSLFAFKPAPIQISWLGYFASTGMDFIDYFIADKTSVTPETENYFCEKIAYLPDTRLCFTPPAFNLEISALPAINNTYITFGCFQGLSKINDEMLNLWLQILNQVPNSILIIKNHQLNDNQVQTNLTDKLVSLGFNHKQFILEGGSSRKEYLQRYSAIDILLDTFPYPGGTTTCEALWMGVPTLTLSGKTLLERQGESILINADLKKWVAYTKEEYIDKAITFSQEIDYLSWIRKNLRDTLPNTPIMNAKIFALNFYNLLTSLWLNYDKK